MVKSGLFYYRLISCYHYMPHTCIKEHNLCMCFFFVFVEVPLI